MPSAPSSVNCESMLFILKKLSLTMLTFSLPSKRFVSASIASGSRSMATSLPFAESLSSIAFE